MTKNVSLSIEDIQHVLGDLILWGKSVYIWE